MESPSTDGTDSFTLSAREAIAAAAQARLVAAGGEGAGTEGSLQRAKEETEHLLRCRRIVDLQIRRDNGYEKAFECLKTLDTLLTNILSHPSEEKYRSFKSENARLKRSVLSISGGTDYLLQAGFGTRTVEFKQQWYLHSSIQPSSPSSTDAESSADPATGSPSASNTSASKTLKWRRLELAQMVLHERLDESEYRVTQKREQNRREAEVEKNRAARVMQEAQEDRERVTLRAQRDRLARARKAEEDQRGTGRTRAGTGTPSPTGNRSGSGQVGAVYRSQLPFGSRPEYQVNTSTLVGGPLRDGQAHGHGAGDREEELSTGIDRSDYTTEIPFDQPSVRRQEAGPSSDDDSGQPPPYGREEWGSGRRLDS